VVRRVRTGYRRRTGMYERSRWHTPGPRRRKPWSASGTAFARRLRGAQNTHRQANSNRSPRSDSCLRRAAKDHEDGRKCRKHGGIGVEGFASVRWSQDRKGPQRKPKRTAEGPHPSLAPDACSRRAPMMGGAAADGARIRVTRRPLGCDYASPVRAFPCADAWCAPRATTHCAEPATAGRSQSPTVVPLRWSLRRWCADSRTPTPRLRAQRLRQALQQRSAAPALELRCLDPPRRRCRSHDAESQTSVEPDRLGGLLHEYALDA
jgi:hypothetical protein